MARLSASISDDTKKELYSVAEERGLAVSHVVQAALDSYLGREGSAPASGGVEVLHGQIEALSRQVEALHQEIRERSGPRRAMPSRFF